MKQIILTLSCLVKTLTLEKKIQKMFRYRRLEEKFSSSVKRVLYNTIDAVMNKLSNYGNGDAFFSLWFRK